MADTRAPLVDVEAAEVLDDERVIHVAQFDPKYISYVTMLFVLVCVLSVGGIPLLLLLPCVIYGFKASFNARELVITEKTIVYKTGVYGCCCMCWNQSSKHVPLEKVTDITYRQGCLERSYGLATIAIQTAGQASPDGRPELLITGIVNAADFRKIVMTAKAQHMAAIYGGSSAIARPLSGKKYGAVDNSSAAGAVPSSSEATQALLAVRDTLNRIEGRVESIEASLSSRTPPTAST